MNERIEINPLVQHGRPVIKGTRVPVIAILGELFSGMSRSDIAREYGIADEDVRAACDFALELVEKRQRRTVRVSPNLRA